MTFWICLIELLYIFDVQQNLTKLTMLILKRKTAVMGVTGNIWRRIVFGPGRSKDFKFMSNQQIFSIEAPHHGDHGVRDLFVAVKRQRGGRLKQSHVVGLLRVPAMRILQSQC